MIKKIFGITAAVVLLGQTVFASGFTDIGSHWARDYIVSLADNGVVDGVTNTEFMPDAYVTRAQYLKMIMESVGIKAVPAREGECLDAGVYDWYSGYLQGALDCGLIPKNMVEDYSESVDYRVGEDGNAVYTKVTYSGKFNANLPINREEMAVLTQYMYQYTRTILTNKKSGAKNVTEFADDDAISDWASASVYQAAENGFMDGMDNNMFNPLSTATRAQAATVIWRVINK